MRGREGGRKSGGGGVQEPELTPELGQQRGDRGVEFNSAEANLECIQVFVGPTASRCLPWLAESSRGARQQTRLVECDELEVNSMAAPRRGPVSRDGAAGSVGISHRHPSAGHRGGAAPRD